MLITVHVVSHTHWDREWYHPAERFRQKLVALIDEVLDAPGEGSFLLDGQTVVLEDYLDVRPERASDVAAALKNGRIEAGPWYVLADELIPGGEGLVRNLLAGRRAMRALRAESPPVLYCPDSFGHPAALPELAAGFDKPLIILWRGLASDADTHWWTSPAGQRVLVYHLTRSGYELGANLPQEPSAAADRWKKIRAEFGDRPATELALLLNGADHHAAQRNRAQSIAALGVAARPDVVTSSTLASFASELGRRAGKAKVGELKGELRNSYGYTWALQGTLASRTPQKRQYAMVERMLVRDVEPWAALASMRGATSRRQLTHAAWKPLLLCQPHDTLCGCSVDAVARAMDQRLESAAAQGGGLREDAILDLVGHDRDAARVAPDRWSSCFLIRNPAARKRSGVALLEWTVKIEDVPVGPGSAPPKDTPDVASVSGVTAQALGMRMDFDRIEAPRAYPDNDLVSRLLVAVWVADAPAYGVMALSGDLISREVEVPHRVTFKGRSLTNDLVTLTWDAKGRITLTDHRENRAIRGLLEWESRTDAGDLYTPAIRRKRLRPKHLGTRLIHKGPLRGDVEQTWRLAGKGEYVDVTLRLIMDAGSGVLRLIVLGDNQAVGHRLRLVFRSDVKSPTTWADAAFGPVQRAPIVVSKKDAAAEAPVPTAPLHRYVSVFNEKRGVTVFADGLTEYETTKDGVAITLLRCVGELSRNDLPERPGHAGWPASTPEAQNIGPFDAELAVMLHGPRTAATIDAIERAADDVLHPITGETLRSAIDVAPAVRGVELVGAGLAFAALKDGDEGGAIVLRCVNLLDRAVAGRWDLPFEPKEAKLARLDETPLTPLAVEKGGRIPFQAPPRGVVTIVVR